MSDQGSGSGAESRAREAALKSLPHGEGFRFLQALSELHPGISGTGTYRIQGDEAFLPGHFPGNPIMPAVLMVEAVAQLGGVVAQSDPAREPLDGLRLTAMRRVKVFGTAVPGEVLILTAKVMGRLGNLVEIEGEVRCEGRTLLRAGITLSGEAAVGDSEHG